MKATTAILSSAALSALLFAGAAAAAGTQLDLRGALGYDSNPFALNRTIGERDGAFTDVELTFDASRKATFGELGFDAGATARRFGSSMDDGDTARYYARVYGGTPKKSPGHAFEWALRYRASDATYVSRFTGRPATSTGASIADRYDSGTADLRAAWALPRGDYGRFALEGAAESKDYRKDYAALGLERLDYRQFGLELRHEAGSGPHEVRLSLPLALRQYRDRRADDTLGNPVPGTDLEYRYYGLDARYDYALSKASTLQATAGYEVRADNGVGYRDRKRWNAGVEWKARLAPGQRVSAGAEWSSRVFDRPAVGDPTIVDETPEKDGYALNAEYAQPLAQSRDLSLFADLQWESFRNSNDQRYTYHRLETLVGVRKVF